MKKIALTLNLGSTSLKASIFDLDKLSSFEAPLDSRTWTRSPSNPMDRASGSNQVKGPPRQCNEALSATLDQVAEWISDCWPIPSIVVHRIVHGGTLHGPCLLNSETLKILASFSNWAPSHQARSLALARAANIRWPSATSIASFDTDWHQTLPDLTRTLPISESLRSDGLRRFGFHGIAYQSVWRQFCGLQADAMERRVVLAHLGGGSSLCAVKSGSSIDTTMGLTPIDGLPMATRSGSIDPGVMVHLLRKGDISADDLEHEFSEHSGLLGISGSTGDMKQLLSRDDEPARLAIDIFTHRTAQGIASMAATLGGIDDLVFSGGIGSNAPGIRASISQRLEWAGLKIDQQANESPNAAVQDTQSTVGIWVLDASEDRELAGSANQWL